MKRIGSYKGIEVFYLDYSKPYDLSGEKNWICFAISNLKYEKEKFQKFSQNAIDHNLLGFKTQGKYGDNLHIEFDLLMCELELFKNYPDIDICTTGNNYTDLANAFWECFLVTALPEHTDYNNLKIICVNIDECNYMEDLCLLLSKFNQNWIPEDNYEED